MIAAKDNYTGKLYVVQVIMDRESPSHIIKEMYKLHKKYGFVRMGFEENLFRDLFREAIAEQSKKENNVKLPWHSIWASQDKEKRIYSIEPKVTNGSLLFNKYTSPDFKTQITDYPNCDHNDGLDALEILCKIADPNTGLKAFAFSSINQA